MTLQCLILKEFYSMENKTFKFGKQKLSGISQNIGQQFKLFICAASFEERSLSAPLSLSKDLFEHVLILKNNDVAGAGNNNAFTIETHFSEKAKVIEITKSQSIRTADLILDEFTHHKNIAASEICIDITCMTHETLLIIISLMKHVFGSDYSHALLLYCPAREYDPGTEYQKKWLSKGVKGVRSILGYSGRVLPSKKNRLLVLVGFEVQRAEGLISVYEPNSLALGWGDDPLNSNHKKVVESKHKKLAQIFPTAQTFKFSSSDPYLVRDLLIQEAEKSEDQNLLVAPMNTKLSTIGAALAAFAKPEIQLCYAPAITYNFENYSAPDEVYISFRISGDAN